MHYIFSIPSTIIIIFTIIVTPSPNEIENSVEVWTDFLKVKLHQRSVYLLTEYFHNNTLDPFDVYTQGVSYWNKDERRDMIEDLVRWYIEDCDYLQVRKRKSSNC